MAVFGLAAENSKDKITQFKMGRYFEKRHTDLTRRNCENKKRCKAEVTPETINSYFDKLQQMIQDALHANIINYDETNIIDDPGRKRFLSGKAANIHAVLYIHEKLQIPLFAVIEDGKLLPPYIVYKSKNRYPEWIYNGSDGV